MSSSSAGRLLFLDTNTGHTGVGIRPLAFFWLRASGFYLPAATYLSRRCTNCHTAFSFRAARRTLPSFCWRRRHFHCETSTVFLATATAFYFSANQDIFEHFFCILECRAGKLHRATAYRLCWKLSTCRSYSCSILFLLH